MLYLVPTPIGNLDDITLRAIETLRRVDKILAEDTRVTKKLLTHFDIQTPLSAFHAFNEHKVTAGIVRELESGADLALVTDAGTPGISDPGFLLVRACQVAGVKVTCLPGATAFVPALAASGLPSDKFHFEGFLPHKKGRQTRLQYLATLPHTHILSRCAGRPTHSSAHTLAHVRLHLHSCSAHTLRVHCPHVNALMCGVAWQAPPSLSWTLNNDETEVTILSGEGPFDDFLCLTSPPLPPEPWSHAPCLLSRQMLHVCA